MKENVYRSLENAYSTKVCVYCKKENCTFETEHRFITSKSEGDIRIVRCINFKPKA